MEDIDKRNLNLIISGLPERDEDATDLIEYVKYNFGIWLQQDNILKTERLGRPLGQTGLLRVQFDSKLKRRSVHKMRPITSDENAPKKYGRPDLTKAQQVVDKKLRDDLKSAGKDKFYIYRGKITLRDAPKTPASVSLDAPSRINNGQSIADIIHTSLPLDKNQDVSYYPMTSAECSPSTDSSLPVAVEEVRPTFAAASLCNSSMEFSLPEPDDQNEPAVGSPTLNFH